MESALEAVYGNATEYQDPVDLTIHGTIPSWLSGVLYRTGPATTRIPLVSDPTKTFNVQHWFDGLGMHHRFEIFPGGKRVTYRSHKAAEDLERKVSETGELPGVSFGQHRDPCQTIFRKFFTAFQTAANETVDASTPPSQLNIAVTMTPDMPGWDVSNVKMYTLSGPGPKYLVGKTDSSSLVLLDPTTLQPLKGGTYKDIDPRLDGVLSAAHSCRDHETGDFYNYTLKFGAPSAVYKMFRIAGSDGKVDILAEIKDAPPTYIHSLTMTGRYLVLCIWRAPFKKYGMTILLNKNLEESIDQEWDPKADSIFYVIDRQRGGIVAKYKTPPFFAFHYLNAFDEPTTGDIMIDITAYPDTSPLRLLRYEHMRSLSAEVPMSRPRRFRLKSPEAPSSAKIRDAIVEFLLPESERVELPVISPLHYHKPYRYAYGIHKDPAHPSPLLADAIIKLDMATPSTASATPSASPQYWRSPEHLPSEPIFVPRPGGNAEDDGVLLSVVLDASALKSSLVIIDACDMSEVARAELPTVFPMGFHGVFSQGDTGLSKL